MYMYLSGLHTYRVAKVRRTLQIAGLYAKKPLSIGLFCKQEI